MISSLPAIQNYLAEWVRLCFGSDPSATAISERSRRFLEESLELAQACGCTKAEALQLVEYTFSRPTGRIFAESGGVLTTLAALANSADINLADAAEDEILRIYSKIPAIRAKHATKPVGSALPGNSEPTPSEPSAPAPNAMSVEEALAILKFWEDCPIQNSAIVRACRTIVNLHPATAAAAAAKPPGA